jgi:hypothetical protein
MTESAYMPLKEIQRRIIAECDLNPARSWSVAEAGGVLAALMAIRKGREVEIPNVIHMRPRAMRAGSAE